MPVSYAALQLSVSTVSGENAHATKHHGKMLHMVGFLCKNRITMQIMQVRLTWMTDMDTG